MCSHSLILFDAHLVAIDLANANLDINKWDGGSWIGLKEALQYLLYTPSQCYSCMRAAPLNSRLDVAIIEYFNLNKVVLVIKTQQLFQYIGRLMILRHH